MLDQCPRAAEITKLFTTRQEDDQGACQGTKEAGLAHAAIRNPSQFAFLLAVPKITPQIPYFTFLKYSITPIEIFSTLYILESVKKSDSQKSKSQSII